MRSMKKNTLMVGLAMTVLLLLVAYLVLSPATVNTPPDLIAIPRPADPQIVKKPARPAVQRILFAGDSMMQGVAPIVMRELKTTHPDWLLRNESQQSTGLAVKRRLDWVEKIKREIVDYQLTTVVIFLGPNDP